MLNWIEAQTGLQLDPVHHWGKHPMVGLSALCFAAPASAYLAVTLCLVQEVPKPYAPKTNIQIILYSVLSASFALVIVTCALADYYYKKKGHRALCGKVDVGVAVATFVMCVVDYSLRASALEVVALTSIVIAAFISSGLSRSFEEWVFRHSLWHVVAGAVATTGALRQPPEATRISGHIGQFLICTSITYGIVCAAFLLCCRILPKERREAIWSLGAQYANWQPKQVATPFLDGQLLGS
mmetsp:Transcript_15481/g.30463  ORF Transcript_15481/g.30463 Transcript_15481/m.30463 type:complete len:240 (+) Transcript_15481:49-768(+)